MDRTGRQLPLSFPETLLDFDVMEQTPANARVIAALRDVDRWAQPALFLLGPEKSGLTTMAAAWAAEQGGIYVDARSDQDLATLRPEELAADAVVIDNAEDVSDESWMLNELSAVKRVGGHILLTANRPPNEWSIRSPDLRSRLLATPIVEVGPPDDPLMRARLKRAMSRFGLNLPVQVEDYLVVRLGLSYTAIEETVKVLAGAAGGRRALTVPLARDALEKGADREEDV